MRCLYYLQKLQNQWTQFQNGVLEWSSTRKDRVKFILGEGLPYVSSEESGEEDDRPVYFRRPLTWLKPKYRKSLHYLDKLRYQSLSAKSKQIYRIRCDGDASQRSPPAGIPTYLLVKDNNELNSSIASNGTEWYCDITISRDPTTMATILQCSISYVISHFNLTCNHAISNVIVQSSF